MLVRASEVIARCLLRWMRALGTVFLPLTRK